MVTSFEPMSIGTPGSPAPVSAASSPAIPVRVKVCILAAIVLLIAARKPESFTHPQFYAADGGVFFQDAFNHGAGALFKTYAGYLVLMPRVIALAASWFPLRFAPLLYNVGALGVMLWLTWKLMSPRLKLRRGGLLALSLALLPHTGEVFASLANVQWITALFLLVLLFQDAPRTSWELLGDAAMFLAAAMTGPFVILAVPFFLIRSLDGNWRTERLRFVLIVGVAMFAAIQVLAIKLNKQPLLGAAPDWRTWPRIAGARIAGTLFLPPTVSAHIPSWALLAISALLPAGLVAMRFRAAESAAVSASPPSNDLLALVLLLSFGALVMLASFWKLGGTAHTLVFPANADQYFFIPKLMIVWSAIQCTDIRGWCARWSQGMLGLALLASVVSFQAPSPGAPADWPETAARIERGELTDIAIKPAGWLIHLQHRGKNAR